MMMAVVLLPWGWPQQVTRNKQVLGRAQRRSEDPLVRTKETEMKKLFLTATTLLALAAPAKAEMSKAGVPAGTWCQVDVKSEAEGWMFFKRGKCARDNEATTLILKANGDYILTGLGDEMVCKVNPKSYFKGWADYTCTVYGARVMKQPKRHQKFVIDTGNGGQLGLSTLD
jgi:hypothetical protein